MSGAGSSRKGAAGAKGKGKSIMRPPPESEFEQVAVAVGDSPQIQFDIGDYDLDISGDEEYQIPQPEPAQPHHQSQESRGSTSSTMAGSTATRPTRVPRPASDIFTKHFDKVTLPSGDLQAKCKYCSKVYKFQQGGGYGTLTRHVERNHPVEIGIDRSQTQIPAFSSQSGWGNESKLFKFDESRFREETAKFCAIEQLSFSFSDKLSFENWLSTSANPSIKRIPRNTLKRTLLKLVLEQKKELINEFSSLNSKVSLCSDIWSDHWQSCSYMGITCHWIDNNWNIQKRLLAYRCFNETHTAQNISQLIFVILEEYGLTSKVFSISFDNASANTSSISELIDICKPSIGGRFFHIRCTCHILNLCVQDGLKHLGSHIQPIRSAIHYLWTHPQIMKQWGKFCKTNGMKPKRFARDVPTRWNSTYKLLLSTFEYKDLLCMFFHQHVQSRDIYLFSNQWNICTSICEILKVFNDASDQLSGVYYPTSHLVLTHCCNIACIFNEHIQSNDNYLSQCIYVMKEKWEKYFLNIPEIFLCAFVLDPRLKLDGLQDMLALYYESLSPITETAPNISLILFNIKTHLHDIYTEYNIKYGEQTIGHETHQSTTTSIITSKLTKAQLLLRQRTKRPRGSSSSSQELENYFTTSFDFSDADEESFDILKWWSQRTQLFPILSIMAKEILACPVSTVAVEQAFSIGGNTLDERRSTLRPENLEAQCLLNDWSKAASRTQHIKSDEEDQDETEGTSGTGGNTTEVD